MKIGRSFMRFCVSARQGPCVLCNAIFAYTAAATAQVFLHVALNCLKSQEISHRDWKSSSVRKCSTKCISCIRKHIAGVGFGFGNVGWLVSWWHSGIQGPHWTTWKFYLGWMGADFGTCVTVRCYRRPCFVLQLHVTEPDALTLNFLLETEFFISGLESLFSIA